MKAQLSLEIVLSIFVAFCIIAAAYPVYAHADALSRSSAHSIYMRAILSDNYSSEISNLCGCS